MKTICTRICAVKEKEDHQQGRQQKKPKQTVRSEENSHFSLNVAEFNLYTCLHAHVTGYVCYDVCALCFQRLTRDTAEMSAADATVDLTDYYAEAMT